MSNVSNKYTKQPPLAGSSTKVVLAERAFIAPADTVYTDPVARLDGVDPGAPWEDLGIVGGSKIQMAYTKDIRYVETGIEKVRRGSYLLGKTAEATFMLEQYDISALEALTGLTAAAVGAIGSKIQIGQDDIREVALLFVGCNKVDGKEYHTYCKKGTLSFNIQQEDDFRVMSVSCSLYPFIAVGETEEGYFTMIVLET